MMKYRESCVERQNVSLHHGPLDACLWPPKRCGDPVISHILGFAPPLMTLSSSLLWQALAAVCHSLYLGGRRLNSLEEQPVLQCGHSH